MKKKVKFELTADYVDWKDMLDRLKETIEETCRDVSSFEIEYSESSED